MSIDQVNLPLCRQIAAEHPYPLLFATISGAHLYGFASADSDYDLRGVHVLPAREVLGLHPLRETIEQEGIREGIEIDLVTHDAAKFMRLLLKKNGYVLEQLLSPLVVQTSPEHEAMKALAPRCLTKFHAFHYLGFAETQWKLFAKESPPRVKPLLYVYRVLLTGIHLMRAGVIEANLRHLNAEYKIDRVDDLIAIKAGGKEQDTISPEAMAFHESQYLRLRARLEDEQTRTALPEQNSALGELSELLVRVRMALP